MIRCPATPAVRAGSARSLADEAASAGGNVYDNTREFAAQALERAADAMRELRYGMAGTASAAQRRIGRYADATRGYVADQPVKSALLAAAAGALVMALVLMSRQRRHRY